jgi:hypothetical protein
MQRLHEDDLTGHLLEQGGWHHLCLPAEYEPKHPFVYPATVTPDTGRELPGDPRTTEGELLDPVRLREASRRAAARPRLLRLRRPDAAAPSPPSRAACSSATGGAAGSPASRPPAPGVRVIASWDMRFSDHDKASSSYVVGQVWGAHGADRYLLGQIRARLSFTESLKAVAALSAWRPDATPSSSSARPTAPPSSTRCSADRRADPDRARGRQGRPRRRRRAVRRGRQRLPAGRRVHPVPARLRPDPVAGVHRGARGVPQRRARRPGRRHVAGADVAARRDGPVDTAAPAVQDDSPMSGVLDTSY